ncbi:MAG: DUF2490 domain-containing protein [Gemmatimonadaceae bacterium]
MHLRLVSITSLVTLLALTSLHGQNSAWPSVHQSNGWYGSVYETMFRGSQFGLTTDIQLRRMGLAEHPKQLFAVGGLSYRPTAGLRFTLGGGYIGSTPYGLLPAAYPTREYQIFYQMNLQQHAGELDFAHRFRYENRWIHDVIADDAGKHNSDVRFSHRLRYQFRASHPLLSMQLHKQPLLLIGADEAFIGLTPVDRRVAFDQNRASVGLGLPLSKGERLEVSYMQQWIANTKYKTNEINNTLLVMFVHNYK